MLTVLATYRDRILLRHSLGGSCRGSSLFLSTASLMATVQKRCMCPVWNRAEAESSRGPTVFLLMLLGLFLSKGRASGK